MEADLGIIKKETTTESTINALQEYIINNKLQAGSKLYSENELCRKFQVSRIVVREALQHFKSLGIIDSKPQRGAYLKSLVPLNPYVNHIPYLANDVQATREIINMRAVVELGLCLEIAEIITEENLRKLEEINENLLNAKLKERVKFDIEFHAYLLSIADNRLLSGLRALLIDFFDRFQSKGQQAESYKLVNRKVYGEHRNIIEAFRSKNELEILSAVKFHINEFKKYLYAQE